MCIALLIFTGILLVAAVWTAFMATRNAEKSESLGRLSPWLFLVLGIAPTPLFLLEDDSLQPLIVYVSAACCLVAGYGLLRKTQTLLARLLLSLLLSVGFVMLNMFLTIGLGCINVGRQAP